MKYEQVMGFLANHQNCRVVNDPLKDPSTLNFLSPNFIGQIAQQLVIVVVPTVPTLNQQSLCDILCNIFHNVCGEQLQPFHIPAYRDDAVIFGRILGTEQIGGARGSHQFEIDPAVKGPSVTPQGFDLQKRYDDTRPLYRSIEIQMYPSKSVADYMRDETGGSFANLPRISRATIDQMVHKEVLGSCSRPSDAGDSAIYTAALVRD